MAAVIYYFFVLYYMKEDEWHDKEEAFLRKLEVQCNYMQKHYSKEFSYYNGLSSRFNIPILVISSVNALTAISLGQFVEQNMVSILNAVLSAGTGVLGSIQLYMKLNEKMTKSLNSATHVKRIALKISKELSIDRSQRATEGVSFLNECFTEFNAVLETGNPLEKGLENFLALTPIKITKPGSMASIASALLTPKMSSGSSSPRTFEMGMPRVSVLWGKARDGALDNPSTGTVTPSTEEV
jgi:hypothetical protein